MDPITHGITGAAASQLFSGKEEIRSASVVGMVSAMLADLDIFIHFPSDPLFNIEVHRQFTHSLFFVPFGALIACGLLWYFFKNQLSFRKIYFFSFTGYLTSGLLDACTSYGTQLLWPFVDSRFAWNIISVVDPVFTLGLMIFTGWVFLKKRKRTILFAWSWIVLILSTGIIQNYRAAEAGYRLAAESGHTVKSALVKPTIGNNILWRFMYIAGDSVYTHAIRTGYTSGITIYPGESASLINPSDEFIGIEESVLFRDILRFQKLSEGYLIWHPEEENVLGDARYAMLPTKLSPLWGVKIDEGSPQNHVEFLYFRDAGIQVRHKFQKMLFGQNKVP